MKFADTLGSKRKNQWKNISAVEEEDQLKVNLKILVCGVLTYYAWPPLLIQTFLFWVEMHRVLYRSDVNSPHIPNFNTRLR